MLIKKIRARGTLTGADWLQILRNTMVLLIPVSLFLLFLIFVSSSLNPGEAANRAYLVLFGLAAAATELLSAFNGISYGGLGAAWGAVVCVLCAIAYRKLRQTPVNLRQRIASRWSELTRDLKWVDGLILAAILLILLVTGVTALVSPPNNFDSMTYHMARVVHWIQNHNVNFYPTSIPRQNYSMPLAEYMILHLQVLSRSDILANLVQWSAFFLLIVLAGMIAGSLGASRRGQLFAGLFMAALPIGILESSTTQNDLLVAVFCVSFGYYLLRLIESRSWMDAALAGIAFGLALLTKGTAYIFCAGIGIPLALGGLLTEGKGQWRPLLGRLVVLVVAGLAINAPFYFRNLDLYGQPLSTETERISVDRYSLKGLYANLVRNAAVNAALPVPEINRRLTSMFRDLLGSLADDPEITFPGSSFQVRYLINEDQAGNLLQTLFFLPLIGLLIRLSRRHGTRYLVWSGAVLLAILLYSLLIKWQPWGVRLQLVIFSLTAPLFGVMVNRMGKSTFLALVLALSFSSYSLPYLFLNSNRPLVPLFSKSSPLHSNRIKRFFSDRPQLYQDYADIIAPFYKDLSIFHTERERLYFASQLDFYEDYQSVAEELLALDPKTIGLATGANDWEYPLWALTGQHYGSQEIVLQNVSVKNQSARLGSSQAEAPDLLVVTRNADRRFLSGETYRIIRDTPSVDLLEMIP